jgi:hypothetical protein
MAQFIKKLFFILLFTCGLAHSKCPSMGANSNGSHRETKVEQLEETKIFLDRKNPINFKFGLAEAALKADSLTVEFRGNATLTEYKTNREKVTEQIVNHSAIGSVKLGTLLFAPFYIFSPDKWVSNMAGCTEDVSTDYRWSAENQQETGNKVVVENYFPDKTITLKIEANGISFLKDINLRDVLSSYFIFLGQELYDDQKFISFIKSNQNLADLTITCLSDCENFSSVEDSSLSFRKSISIKADLSYTYKSYLQYIADKKKAVVDEIKRKQDDENRKIAAKKNAEEEKIKTIEEKQKSIERANQAKADAAIKAQAIEQKTLDQYKEKCSNLGFKVGTDAFGKCVLQLTK